MSLPSEPAWPAVQSRRRSLVEQELINSLGWLISLRWLAGAGVLVATAVATLALRVPLPPARLYLVGGGILLYNAGFWLVLRWLLRVRPEAMREFETLARAQIVLDWLAMTVLIASSGGAESPAIIFFLIHITIASLLLPHRRGFLYVTLAPALVGLVALLEYAGALEHVAIVQPARYREPLYVSSVLLFFAAACYVMAYSCMTIARRLRRREHELGGLYDGVRDVTSTLEITTVLDRIVEAAARVLTCKAAAIRLIDQSRSLVEFAASWGLSDTYRDEVPGEYAKSVLDQDTLRDGVVHVTDIENDPRIWHPELVRDERIASMLSVAIKGRTGPMGVLRAYGSPGHEFGAEDIAYLQAVAAHGAVAIENAKAYRLLADLDRDKSRFLRITTHELRSPVRVTESLLMTLGDGFVGTLAPEQTEVLQRAQRRLASLHELIDDLLDLAAGKADMAQVQPKTVDLRDVAAEVTERLRTVAEGKGLTLLYDRPGEPIEVFCDPADLDRIVVNLVGNAVKYTASGHVRVSLAMAGGRVRLEVADTGIGIPREALPSLFNEFYRAPNAKAAGESGTGLGLAIVKLLVARYGGEIGVASEEGTGTTMTVTLPPSPAAPGMPLASA
ncbi:MAG TPA: GAF domain-containing sensor histidine kinase [Vicinamibacterales bacterium]|nr:GAF domain-containing sensor histidine kinase [Vicinamibacterales bacterium]